MFLSYQAHQPQELAPPSQLLKSLEMLRWITKVLFLSLLIGLSAQVSIPLWPVPVTLQPFAVLLIALSCNPTLAISSISAYVLEGSLGLPVFEGFSGGFHHIIGPTGGYIIGFLSTVAIVSSLKSTKMTNLGLFALGAVAQIHLLVMGCLWLSSFIGFNQAINAGFLPFLFKLPFETLFAIFTWRLASNFKSLVNFCR